MAAGNVVAIRLSSDQESGAFPNLLFLTCFSGIISSPVFTVRRLHYGRSTGGGTYFFLIRLFPSSNSHNMFFLLVRAKQSRMTLLLFVLFLSVPSLVQAQQLAKTSPAGTKMWVYTPPAYSAKASKFPLLIFLHGQSEIGDDLSKLSRTSQQVPPQLLASGQWNAALPLIVVSPQLKKDPLVSNSSQQEWRAAYIDEVIEYVKKSYRVDPNRIYLTGVASGATACWAYAAQYSEKIAAINPIAGKADKTKAYRIKNIPVWAFHGENDTNVSTKSSIDMINEIKACNGGYRPKLTLLHAKNPEGWNEIYNNHGGYNLYEWFLKFSKGSVSNVPPYVNAGVDRRIVVSSGYHTLAGDFFDWNGSITSIKWTQTAGTALPLWNSNTAFLRVGNLKTGLYEFQLSVKDNQGAVSTDRVTVEVTNGAASPAVTSLVLMNGMTNADLQPIKEGMVINKTALGTSEFNVRAIVTTGVRSVRFHVNSERNSHTVSAVPYVIRKQSSTPEWQPFNGTCVICATPYTQSGGKGNPGVTSCYRVTFTETSTMAAGKLAQPDEVITIRAIDDIIISNMATGNQWVCNGVDIPGATGPIHKPLTPGDYYVRQLSRPSMDVSGVVSYDPRPVPPTPVKVGIYPNPAREFITVQAPYLPERSSYRILRGETVVQQGELYYDRKITLAPHLAKGSYILVVNGRKGADGVKFNIK
jgi:predicted esterase